MELYQSSHFGGIVTSQMELYQSSRIVTPKMELYQSTYFGGIVTPLTNSVPNLSAIGITAVGSHRVHNGIWVTYTKTDYQGPPNIYHPNSHTCTTFEDIVLENDEILEGVDKFGVMHDKEVILSPKSDDDTGIQIASVKLLKAQIILYSGATYTGSYLSLDESVPRLGAYPFNGSSTVTWNDKASSVRVVSGKWKLYQHYNYKGKSSTPASGCGLGGYSPIPNVSGVSSVQFIAEV